VRVLAIEGSIFPSSCMFGGSVVVGVTAAVIGGAVGGAVGAFCGAGSLRPHADKASTNTAPMVNDAAARAFEPPPELFAGSFKDTPLSQQPLCKGIAIAALAIRIEQV
jgi:hypothetical protein